MRFSVGGWLAKRLVSVLPTNGSTMNMLFIAGLNIRDSHLVSYIPAEWNIWDSGPVERASHSARL